MDQTDVELVKAYSNVRLIRLPAIISKNCLRSSTGIEWLIEAAHLYASTTRLSCFYFFNTKGGQKLRP